MLTLLLVPSVSALCAPYLDELPRGDEPVALVVPGQRGHGAGALQAGGLHPPVVKAVRGALEKGNHG